ncbi:MAG TPA: autotransporter-associated beta strand repeat-containing protein, partial [Clostridia bacterium]|nr:autotransporter-associated beta strand repeat-containing protein [Clostridia bacterium]
MKKPTLLHLVIAAGLCLQTASAADKYWDLNGADEGSGASPVGTWDTTAANWSTDAAGTLNAIWADGDFAIFSAGTDAAGPYTVTLGAARTASGLTVEEGSVILAGPALTVGANKVTIKPGAKLSISGSSALVGAAGGLIELDGGTMENRVTGNAGSFVSGLFTINVTAAGGTLSFPTVNILNIVQPTPAPGTTISGPGGITKVGAGVLAIASTCTYAGTTTINEGELRIRTSADRLPVTTPVVVNSPGILNLNGVSQKIGSLSGNGNVGTGGGTLTIDGSASTTFDGALKNIANAGASGVTTGNGRLIKAGSGTITFNGLNDIRGSVTLN